MERGGCRVIFPVKSEGGKWVGVGRLFGLERGLGMSSMLVQSNVFAFAKSKSLWLYVIVFAERSLVLKALVCQAQETSKSFQRALAAQFCGFFDEY